MGKSRIEYVNTSWSAYTGCLHGQAECPVSGQCWARGLSHRFQQVCGGDFQPRFHPERLSEPLHWRKPRRVAVCFMGDLFGDWKDVPDKEGLHYEMSFIQRHILFRAYTESQHTFLFLTKNPIAYLNWNPWPSNAWVGMSLTGAETPERQAAMWAALEQVQARIRWLSFEPMLGPLAQAIPPWVNWLVMGAQSGKGAKPPDPQWAEMILRDLGFVYNGPIWVKRNLVRYLPWFQVQQLPL